VGRWPSVVAVLDLRARSRAGLLTGIALALLLLAPVLGPGYVLIRDMAFVPRTPLGGQLLGLDGVPRGVPSELFVALASRVLAAGWLQDLVLVTLVVGGAWGAARLAPTASRAAAVAAATTYGWSAYLHERLLLGQWALLVGWAVLPWAVRAALDWRRGAPGWWAVTALAVAACAGANALLVVALAVVVCGRPVKALAATVVLSLPWVVPGLLQDLAPGDPGGVAAFSANSDTPLGILGSLLTGGGVWSREATPPGRSAGAYLALLVLLVGVVGLPLLRRRLGSRLLVAAAVGLLMALLAHLPLLDAALRWAVVHVPATGVLRDAQKWIAPLVLLVSVAVACGTEQLLAGIPEPTVRRVAAVLLVLTPLAALPGAAWAEGGRLKASTYPADWAAVTGQAHGAVLVLPWSLYRSFAWEHGEAVLDPATKLLARPVVNDGLPLPGGTVRGEDRQAARMDGPARTSAPLLPALRAVGIDQVLVERTASDADPARVAVQVQGLTVVVQTPELSLYAVPGGGRRHDQAPVLPVVLADLLAVALAVVAVTRTAQLRRAYLPEP
jgi:hypothetical protein